MVGRRSTAPPSSAPSSRSPSRDAPKKRGGRKSVAPQKDPKEQKEGKSTKKSVKSKKSQDSHESALPSDGERSDSEAEDFSPSASSSLSSLPPLSQSTTAFLKKVIKMPEIVNVPQTPQTTGRRKSMSSNIPLPPSTPIKSADFNAAYENAVHSASVIRRKTLQNTQTFPPSYGSSVSPPSDPSSLSFALSEISRARDDGRLQFTEGGDQHIVDIHSKILYQPHTVTALIVAIGTLCYFAYTSGSPTSTEHNVKMGVLMCCVFLCLLGLLVFPSGPFIRPHPLVWRLAFGVAVCYELFLIFMLFQTKQDARKLMGYLDPKVNEAHVERSYAENCSLTPEAIMGNLDRFVASHFFGWMVKSLMIRDLLICWILSISWELIEIGLVFVLPNFAECWWDQWVLDVLLANGIGIYCGKKLADYLELKSYHWTPVSDIPSWTGKAKRAMMQFTPSSWAKVRWESTKTLGRFLAVNTLIFSFQINELNAFMLKAVMGVPPSSSLNVYRLFIWAFTAVACTRQVYQYVNDPKCKRIGMQSFLTAMMLITEILLIIKNIEHQFDGKYPTPPIRLGWMVFFVSYIIFFFGMCIKIVMRKKEEDATNKHSDFEH